MDVLPTKSELGANDPQMGSGLRKATEGEEPEPLT